MAKAKEGLKMPMGSAHWEDKQTPTKCADEKYSSQFGNPEDLKKSVDDLASYVKKNRMKY